MDLTVGTFLQQSKYVLGAPIAAGPFKIAYRAVLIATKQPILIETLHESLRQHPRFDKFQERFLARSTKIAKCQHPNVLRIVDVFEEGDRVFAVTDYTPGVTLEQLLASSQPVPVAVALNYIRQIAAGLQALHQCGCLHLNVNPANIIRRSNLKQIVLTHFGMAHKLTAGAVQIQAQQSAGYAPLEQFDPKGRYSPATDIYALSATLYHMLTGRPPVAAPQRNAHPSESGLLFDRLKAIQPNLNSAIEQAIRQGLELNAENRPQTIDAWMSILLPKPAPISPTATNLSTDETDRDGSHAGTEKTIAETVNSSSPQSDPQHQGIAAVSPHDPPESLLKRFPIWIPLLFAATSFISAISGAGIVFALRWNIAFNSHHSSPWGDVPLRTFEPDFAPDASFVEEATPAEFQAEAESEAEAESGDTTEMPDPSGEPVSGPSDVQSDDRLRIRGVEMERNSLTEASTSHLSDDLSDDLSDTPQSDIPTSVAEPVSDSFSESSNDDGGFVPAEPSSAEAVETSSDRSPSSESPDRFSPASDSRSPELVPDRPDLLPNPATDFSPTTQF